MISSLQLKVLFWLAVGAWALLLVIDGQPITISLFKPSSLVLSTIIVVVTVFEKWAWRWSPLYPWFVRTPNLLGAYKGEVNSHWVDPATGKQRGAIPAFLVVHQTLSSVHIRLYTAESESCSVLGAFVEAPDGRTDLLFTYRSEPRLEVRPRSPIHYGGARLAIGQESDQLEGSYWTDRQTIGTLNFRRISRKTPHSFSECAAL
ncbi:MAG: hypothetical protein HGA45_41385 [Chloroflexales bacterium]|nr:hypothetical protein [Chloroflexales bacterium]